MRGLIRFVGRFRSMFGVSCGSLLLMFALALTASGGSGNSASATSNQSSIDGGHDVNSSEAASEPEEHGLSPKAVEIARPLGFPITNSMLVS